MEFVRDMIKANDPSVRTIRTVCGALDYFQAIQPENRFSAESIFKKKNIQVVI
jgi:hypothetical protein